MLRHVVPTGRKETTRTPSHNPIWPKRPKHTRQQHSNDDNDIQTTTTEWVVDWKPRWLLRRSCTLRQPSASRAGGKERSIWSRAPGVIKWGRCGEPQNKGFPFGFPWNQTPRWESFHASLRFSFQWPNSPQGRQGRQLFGCPLNLCKILRLAKSAPFSTRHRNPGRLLGFESGPFLCVCVFVSLGYPFHPSGTLNRSPPPPQFWAPYFDTYSCGPFAQRKMTPGSQENIKSRPLFKPPPF